MRPATAASWLPRIVTPRRSRTMSAHSFGSAVTDDVAETVELVDALGAVSLHDGAERFEVRVHVAEDG